MKKLVLIFTVAGLCYIDRGVSMERKDIGSSSNSRRSRFVLDFNNTDELTNKIKLEDDLHKFHTAKAVLELAEKGNDKAFRVIQRLLDEHFSGISYSIALGIHEKKFVSSTMAEMLLINEEVQDSLNEIQNRDEVDRIICEGTGTNNHWIEVLKNARNGDTASLNVIIELLEKKYLIDLPYVIARCLGKGIFSEDIEKMFSEKAIIKKQLKKLENYKIQNDDDLKHFFI